MRLRYQLALSAFALFALIFNGAGLMLIEISAHQRFQDQLEAMIGQNRALDGLLTTTVSLLQFYPSVQSLDEQLKNQLEKMLKENVLETGVRILDDSGVCLAENQFPEIADDQLTLPQPDQIWLKTKRFKDREYLISAHQVALNSRTLIVQTSAEITELRLDQEHQRWLFLIITLVASAVYLGAMIVISRRLTHPVELLAERERQIASGNWHQRLDLSGSRELKALAVNFNRMAETVEQKVAELETGNQEKEIFIHNLSHEMKTPLTSILGYAQLLRRTAMKPEDAEKALDVIESEARRMEQLSSRLMQLIMAAQPLPPLKSQSVEQLVKQAAVRLEPVLQAAQLQLIVESEPLELEMEEELMQAALRNVLDNAVKASSAGGRLWLSAFLLNTTIIIAVRDEGRGIQDPHPERMLEPFVMEDKARTRKHYGAGLGLALTQRIVTAHGGRVEVKSKPHAGTEIRFVFPLPSEQPTASDKSQLEKESAAGKAKTGKEGC